MNTLSPIISNNYSSSAIKNSTNNIKFKSSTNAVDSIQKVNNFDKNTVPQKMLLSLLKNSISGQKVDESLFVGRSYEDWVRMYNLSHNNAVTAVAYDALKNTPNVKIPNDVKENFEISHDFAEKYHARQEKTLAEFSKMTASNGINTVQMKGVGFSMNYPNPTSRFGGDIDVFNFASGTNPSDSSNNKSFVVDNLANKYGMTVDDHGYKHSCITYKKMPIENHRSFLNIKESPLTEKMNKYLEKVINPKTAILPHGTKILVPSKEFNTVFISYHAMQHYLGGGINLHHLADWAVHVQKNGLKVPEEAKNTKYEKFMYAMTNLANKHLGTNIKVPEDKNFEDSIMNKILYPDNDLKRKNISNTKNPLKVFKYKLEKLIERETTKKEFYGNGSILKSVASSLKFHLLNPKTLINLVKLPK